MKPFLLFLLFIPALLCNVQSAAQQPSKAQTDRWFNEMRAYKTEFIAKSLELTPEQKEKFVPVYNAMNAELDKIARETRALERSVAKNNHPTDLEYEKATEALFELRSREGDIDRKYYPQLREILTKKQLFKLKSAERRFGRHLMKHREGKAKSNNKK